MKKFRMTAQEVQNLIISLDVTQEEFAGMVGVCLTTVNRWVNDKSVPNSICVKVMKGLIK